MRYQDAFEMVGHTPHIRVRLDEPPRVSIYAKLEGCNPTGSIKDRAAVTLIRHCLATGALRPGMTILDASSGNMGCAIAYFGRLLGYPSRVVSSSKLTGDKRDFMRYFGAEVEQVGEFTIEGNRVCRELAAQPGNPYCFLDQLHAWENPRAYYTGTGPEILEEFPEIEMLVGSLGTGGSLVGTAEFLKERLPSLKVVAVESAAGTRIPGTGSFDDGDYVTPFIQHGLDQGLFDLRVKISLDAAVLRTKHLRDQGIFAGLQTGGLLDAALTMLQTHAVSGDVVLLSADSGWKNMEKLRAL